MFVTFLWSTSYIIIKLGLSEMKPITFAGLRYFGAFICFIPFIFQRKYITEVKQLKSHQIKKLIWLGLLFYTFTQGTQFMGLSLLPAVTVSLMLNFTPLIVAIMGIFLIAENLTAIQWMGAIIFFAGILIYFIPISAVGNSSLGLIIMSVGVIANSGSAVMARDVNRSSKISPLVVTCISMGAGSTLLIITGFTIEGFPVISLTTFFFLIWLIIVNTAFAFTIWNFTLRTLTAVESSIINSVMLIQIAVLAYLFLGEEISFQKGSGMIIAAIGIILVQINRKNYLKAAVQ
ncbi:MAG: DMT family transporter [Ignavibacteriaceae bacterium]